MTHKPMEGFDALAAARAVAATLRPHSGYGEENGRVAPESLEALKRAGMLDLWRPRSLGGKECSPAELALATEEIAAADSAAAWMMHGASAVWLDLRRGDPGLIAEISESAKSPFLIGTIAKPMVATSVEGGYRVTGATPFASGCSSADWIAHTALDGGRLLLIFHPAGALEIEEDWDALGMRGTASNTITAKDLFVPRHRTIDWTAAKRNPRFDGPLYSLPEGIIPVAVAAVALGVLRAALDTTTEIAGKKTPFAAQAALKHRVLAQSHFGRALSSYRAARCYLHACAEEAYARAGRGEPFDLHAKADLFLAYAHVLENCAAAVRMLAKAAGTSVIRKGTVLERALRDAEVVSHHATGAEGRFASAAQAYWDVELDFPLLALD